MIRQLDESQQEIAEAVINEFAARRGFVCDAVRGRYKFRELAALRTAIAKELHSRGWSTTMIGGALNKDHSAVIAMMKR